MKQIVQPLRSSQAGRQWQIAHALIVLGLLAAGGRLAGQSIGLTSHGATALAPISILTLVAGLALATLTRRELKGCQAQQGWLVPRQAASDPKAGDAAHRLQLIQGDPAADEPR